MHFQCQHPGQRVECGLIGLGEAQKLSGLSGESRGLTQVAQKV